MPQPNSRHLSLIVLFLILVGIALAYSPLAFDRNYQGEDYIFLSQVVKHGFFRSVLISWKDHFIPLYRAVWGGLYLVSEKANPMRVLILFFHLLNAALIFHIVRSHTKTIVLPAIASVTFAFSQWVASSVFWCINGHWGMSLCSLLVMSLCFDRFVTVNTDPDIQPGEGAVTADSKESGGNGKEAASPSVATAGVHSARLQAWRMSPYYLGLACFAVGLGFFTVALAGGVVIWLFLCWRIIRARGFKRDLRFQMRIVIPFLIILVIYLPLRSYFNVKSRPFQDPLTQFMWGEPEVPLERGVDIIVSAPPEFYSTAVKRMLPYFSEQYWIVLLVLALLLIKEVIYRRKEIRTILMWVAFALLTLAMPVIGRIFFIFKGVGFVDTILFPWYFSYPLAGVSIVLALLLRPTPSLERAMARSSPVIRVSVSFLIIVLLVVLNTGNARTIHANTTLFLEENRKFYEVVMRYRSSMTSFLQSSSYSPDGKYELLDDFVADKDEFPLNWSVTQRDIFNLYFPHVETIRFITRWHRRQEFYVWTREAVRYTFEANPPHWRDPGRM